MPKIDSVSAQKILDSRSAWTVRCSLVIGGVEGVASVPGGTSVGKYEAKVLPVNIALKKIENLKQSLIGKSFSSQQEFDNFLISLDGTADKSNLGGNVLLSLSFAFARAFANYRKCFLYSYISEIGGFKGEFKEPNYMFLVFEGGRHGHANVSIQEFMVVVSKFEDGKDVYKSAEKYLEKHKLPLKTGLEGAFNPIGLNDFDVLNILKDLSHHPIALDVASSSRRGECLDYNDLLKKYPIVSLEDPYGEEDWDGWVNFAKVYKDKITIVGDDLTVTNTSRIKKAVDLNAINAVIIKPNQVGTLTETIRAINIAKENGLKVIVSHRSGETCDTFIADLAIGCRADCVKFGALRQKERAVKYNRIQEILMGLGV